MHFTNYKFKTLISASTLLLFSQTAIAENNEEGKNLFKAHCDVCHGMAGGMNMKQRLAPPIAAVRMHYIRHHPDQTSFVNAVTAWVEHQDPNKSLMRGAIRRFNIMPPIPVKKGDAIKIANYMYNGKLETPKGMAEHIRQQHKKNGMNLNR